MAQILSEVKVRDKGTLTDVVHGVLLRHVLCDASHHVHGVLFAEEVPAQLRVVTDEDSGVEFAFVQAVPCIFKKCLGKALEAQTLVHVAQLVEL